MAQGDNIYSLECEWCSCGETFESVMLLSRHLADVHLFASQQCAQPNKCFWSGCDGFDAENLQHLQVHVLFHAYHTHLKDLGWKYLDARKRKNENLQCQLVAASFRVPDVSPNGYVCAFGPCYMVFVDFNAYLVHVEGHVLHAGCGTECLWTDCRALPFKNKHKLLEHLQVHTGGKKFACPQCGYMFANSSKLVGHCMRQLFDKDSFKCTFCDVGFASKSLLTEHMRSHVRLYHCAQCSASFATKANMRNHWLFKHNDTRNFKCSLCSYAAKTQNDLLKHLHSHEKGNSEVCMMCGAAFRSKPGLHSHIENKHGLKVSRSYKCHICGKLVKNGQLLTTHLMRNHDYQRPSGGRSVYRRGPEGYYVLQEKLKCQLPSSAPISGFLVDNAFTPVQSEMVTSTPARDPDAQLSDTFDSSVGGSDTTHTPVYTTLTSNAPPVRSPSYQADCVSTTVLIHELRVGPPLSTTANADYEHNCQSYDGHEAAEFAVITDAACAQPDYPNCSQSRSNIRLDPDC